MPVAIVLSHQHVAHELGNIGLWLDAKSFTVQHIYREQLPDLPQADLLVALGSPNSVADGFCAAPAQAEINAVAQWVQLGKPYIGVCFGAQVLACALGGSVRRMPTTYRAYTQLEQVAHRPLLDGCFAVWHEDAITAPAQAEVLASLPHADMVFRVGNAWGIQPHIEFDAAIVERLAQAMDVSDHEWQPLRDQLDADSSHSLRAQHLLDGILESGELGEIHVH